MAAVPPEARALLGLFLDAPAVVVEDLGASPAGRAGVRAHPAHQIGSVDVAAAHAVDVTITRGFAILTAEPGPLRAIDPDVAIEELPGSSEPDPDTPQIPSQIVSSTSRVPSQVSRLGRTSVLLQR